MAWLTRVLEILPIYRGNYTDLLPGKLELPTTTGKQLQALPDFSPNRGSSWKGIA